jgi:hypothetical protein
MSQSKEREPRSRDFSYTPNQETTVELDGEYAGFIVVSPQTINAAGKTDFRVDLFVSNDVGSIRFIPKGPSKMIFDVPTGFALTPENLTPLVTAAWKAKGGLPPPTGEVRGLP